MPSQTQEDGSAANGMACAVGCYTMWGLLPVYFHMLQDFAPLEIVAQRLLWSLAFMLVIIALRTGLPAFGLVLRDPRLMKPLAASSALIAINWLVYIWAVHNGHVVAASFGYFLNPLINIMLGVIFLKEKLRRGQMIAVGVAATGVAILGSSALDTLWISLVIGLSFGLYGLVRKVTPVAPMRGLGAETVILAPFAAAYLLWLYQHGGYMFGKDTGSTILLTLSGAITAIPLLLFAVAAQRLSMATLGVLQYIAPTLQFLTGVLLFGETLSRGQLISFSLIWAGLILFTIDSLRGMRAARLASIPAEA
ncbi:MAG: EamA family transporter RarD [Sphingobium phenoxybenzoativorans]